MASIVSRKRTILAVVLATAALEALAASTARATVSRSQRNAVVFVSDLSTGFSGLEMRFYQAVEQAAYLGAVTTLSPVYHEVFQVEGSNATLVTLRNALNAAKLRGASVATGGRTVRLKLPLTLLRRATARVFRVEVAASDHSGRKTPWNLAGVLAVDR
jgi:hypothetical protein